ncbi:hypothetical protein [Streptomyces sp. NPDC051219]|uniref:hypothetical protein n=1 Tax=Streptomyces sp. NPDC051219 TaxID=3155283 RepID=UPI00343B552D
MDVTVALDAVLGEFGDGEAGLGRQVVHDLVDGFAVGDADGDVAPRVAGFAVGSAGGEFFAPGRMGGGA